MFRVNRRLLATSQFRLAVGYMALFVVSVVVLLAFLYWSTALFVAGQTEQTIEAELQGLAEHYRNNGLVGLSTVIRERSRGQRQSLYILADPERQPIVGNLDAWPRAAADPEGWISFTFERPGGSRPEFHQAEARHFVLPQGFHLLVGRDVQERFDMQSRLKGSLVWVVLLTLGLGLVGGLVMSRNWLRRIEAVNRTSREIMAGDLARRVPVSGTGDELDRLAENLNAMLERIEALMTGLRQVTDNIAHDLRSPLNRMRARLEVALLEDASAEERKRTLEETIAEADGLLKTFNALLLIGEAEAGLPSDRMAAVDLAALCRDVCELYEPVAETKGLEFVARVSEVPPVKGNGPLLSQALANLLDNAIKYTPEGGRVAVECSPSNRGAAIEVSDSGPGVPEGDRERVFDRFVRLEESRNSPGSGLGLSLVAAVARLHRGDLDLGDNEPGLRVRLVLPMA